MNSIIINLIAIGKVIGTIVGSLMVIGGIYLVIKIISNLDIIVGEDSDDFSPIAGGFGLFGLSLLIGLGLKILNFIWHLW